MEAFLPNCPDWSNPQASAATNLDFTDQRIDADLRTPCADARRIGFAAVMLYPGSVSAAKPVALVAVMRKMLQVLNRLLADPQFVLVR
ncbi:MAG: hypothetical protein PHQ04_12580 [Opitutaceae bacterium]|nr:hypothetical protein [Opitutaceae bacterium]